MSSAISSVETRRLGCGRILSGLLANVAGLGGLALLGWLGLRSVVGERSYLVAQGNHVLHLGLLAGLGLLVLALLSRRGWAILLALPGAAVAAFTVLPTLVNVPLTPPLSDARAVSVLSYNILYANRDDDAVAAVILGSNADVVALQELTPRAAAALAARLGDVYPHSALLPAERAAGLGVFSRFPLGGNTLTDAPSFDGLGTQRVRVARPAGAFLLYNVHTMPPVNERALAGRERQVGAVLADALVKSEPSLLVGDFNMTPFSDDTARVRVFYEDAFARRGFGLGFTYPATGELTAFGVTLPVPPLARIDYVFAQRRAFEVLEARVLPSGTGSDHRPLYVRVRST